MMNFEKIKMKKYWWKISLFYNIAADDFDDQIFEMIRGNWSSPTYDQPDAMWNLVGMFIPVNETKKVYRSAD
jgi:hypothetical protein